MISDDELLRRYAKGEGDESFTELVGRHLTQVYATARRTLNGDSHTAADVVQETFSALAVCAKRGRSIGSIGSWLHGAARNAAVTHVRREMRVRQNEKAVQLMHELYTNESDSSTDTSAIAQVLDEALLALPRLDREAILLRCLSNRPYADVGRELKLSYDAARMKVERALEKLKAALCARGITSGAALLAMALEGQVGAAVPSGLGQVVARSALAAGARQSANFFMGMTKLQLALVGSFAVTAAAVFGWQGTPIRTSNPVDPQSAAPAVQVVHEDPAAASKLAESTAPAATRSEVRGYQMRGGAAPVRPEDGVQVHFPKADLRMVLDFYELHSGQTIRRDPTVEKSKARITVDTEIVSKETLLAILRDALVQDLYGRPVADLR